MSTCGECRNWFRQSIDLKGGIGICYGTPPTPVLVGMDRSGQPIVSPFDPTCVAKRPSCVFFQPREVALDKSPAPEGKLNS